MLYVCLCVSNRMRDMTIVLFHNKERFNMTFHMAAFCRIVDSHRLYHVGLPAVVTINGNVIFVNPLSKPIFGRIASVQSDRPHESAITLKLVNYICRWKIIWFRMTKCIYEKYFRVLTCGIVLVFLCENYVCNFQPVNFRTHYDITGADKSLARPGMKQATFPYFMEIGGSLPHSQQSTTCPYPSQINPFLCPSQFW